MKKSFVKLLLFCLYLISFHLNGQEKIQEIRLDIHGGRCSQNTHYKINKDSIYHYNSPCYNKSIFKQEKNFRKNTEPNWLDIVRQIDLQTFKSLENGMSYQVVDGQDKTITIKTDKATYSKRNFNETNKEFYDKIMGLIQKNFTSPKNIKYEKCSK